MQAVQDTDVYRGTLKTVIEVGNDLVEQKK